MARYGVLAMAVVALLLTGCGAGIHGQAKGRGAAVDTVQTFFVASQVPGQCQVTHHVLVGLPGSISGQEIRQRIEGKAAALGADTVLVGQSREQEDEAGIRFQYFGPDQPYLFTSSVQGWEWGYEEWQELGDWVGIGFPEWGNAQYWLDVPAMLQVMFLRCRPNEQGG